MTRFFFFSSLPWLSAENFLRRALLPFLLTGAKARFRPFPPVFIFLRASAALANYFKRCFKCSSFCLWSGAASLGFTRMEARAGIEPAHTGFADQCITTLLPRRFLFRRRTRRS